MPKYSLTNNGNVVQCKWDCKCNHEHYIGTYERAVKYFGVSQNDIQSYGDIFNIIYYHQTSQFTIPKLSNELYDILIDSMSEHKYWTPENLRHQKAIEALNKAKKAGLIKDIQICKTIKEKGNVKSKQRVYIYNLWCEQIGYEPI